MQSDDYLPHIELILRALRINQERLNSKSKIAVDARLLRVLLQALVTNLSFSEEFYMEAYPDIAEAYAAGEISDLHRHFVDQGFFEGRMGAAPVVDEAYYLELYQDVADAVQRGDVASGAAHYTRSGAAEGRVPSAAMRPVVEAWLSALLDASTRG